MISVRSLQRSGTFRPHKVYIHLISITRRVDLAIPSVGPFLRKLVFQF